MISSIGRRTSSGTDAAAALEIIAPSRGCTLLELTISLAAATASVYGLGRPAAKGITPTTPVTSLSQGEPEGVAAVTTAIAWGTGPTVPAQFLRRVAFPNVIGSTIIWSFPEGITIPATKTLVLWNLGTNGVVDVTIVTKENGPL